jgi:hypothetical protein
MLIRPKEAGLPMSVDRISTQVLVGLTAVVLGWGAIFMLDSPLHVIGGLGAVVGGSGFAALTFWPFVPQRWRP